MQRLRLRRLKRVFFTCLVLAFLCTAGYAGYALANSTFFDLTEISVEGNVSVSREEVIDRSGLRIGINILKVSRGEVAESLRAMPGVKDVKVSRILPGKMEIRISERIPVVLVSGAGRHLILDEYGYCISEVGLAAAESWPLPIVRCSEEAAALEPGEQSLDKGIQAALALIQKLDPYFLENILEFDAPSAERLSVINTDGLPVYFGQPEDLDRKLQNYEELLIKNAEKCNARTLNYVDLRYDTQITLSWK